MTHKTRKVVPFSFLQSEKIDSFQVCLGPFKKNGSNNSSEGERSIIHHRSDNLLLPLKNEPRHIYRRSA